MSYRFQHIVSIVILFLLVLCVSRAAAEEIIQASQDSVIHETDSLISQRDSIAHTADSLVCQIIADRKDPRYHDFDYFSCSRYERMKLALNDIDPLNLEQNFVKKRKWLSHFIEKCGLNNKNILPIMFDQRVERIMWRKHPQRELVELIGINKEGLNEIMDAGDVTKFVLGKKYADFNLFDDFVVVDGSKMNSPLGRNATEYYRYDIVSRNDSTAIIEYYPKADTLQNLEGQVIAIKDSVWKVKIFSAYMPILKKTKYVNKLYIYQEYGNTIKDKWALIRNDVLVELHGSREWGDMCYITNQEYSRFSIDSISKRKLRGKSPIKYNGRCDYRPASFWAEYDRSLERSLAQEHLLDSLRGGISDYDPNGIVRHRQSYLQHRVSVVMDYGLRMKEYRLIAAPIKAIVNDFIELGNPPMFSLEPITSFMSFNDIDGFRLRVGGTTMANFSRHLFLKGYVAYGFKQHNVYYNAKATYSFTRKRYDANEFPRRNINLESRYDISYLGERNSHVNDRDDIFSSFHWNDQSWMMFYRFHRIEFERDEKSGFGMRFSVKFERDRATGGLDFRHLKDLPPFPRYFPDINADKFNNGTISTTELRLELLYCPKNDRYYSRRKKAPINSDLPSMGLAHTIGVKFLGGEYKYHMTELKVTKLWFLGSVGIAKTGIKAGAIWNTVPYPLLLAPPANISYIGDAESFHLIDPFEFANDRYVQLMASWETNGNVIGLIPLIKRLRWKEYLSVRMLWGSLSDKNNPTLPRNRNSDILMPLPEGSYIMDEKIPYMEGAIGIHSIFHVLDIDYVYRFTYRTMSAKRSGIRFKLHYDF